MKKPWLCAPLALSTMLICAGCATSSPRHLPTPPADFGRPVMAPEIHRGDDARALAARLAGALVTANTRLKNDAAFYADVQKGFAAP